MRKKIVPKLRESAITILKARYLARDETNRIIENPEELFERVAFAIAEAEKEFKATKEKWELFAEKFYEMMARLDFLPNSPTLMNAGRPLGQLSACFVLPIEDSLDSIFETLKQTALIHKSGGGTGFNFSKLRPKGDIVSTTSGVASGPVSFMKVFDSATEAIKQGGKRRGANMGILNINHPDIEEFIQIKREPGVLTNFNISVGMTEDFFKALRQGEDFPLINPRNQRVVRRVHSTNLFELICQSAWETGDPGLLFLDNINRANPTPHLGELLATNPCGEQPLLPYESCNLGSINLVNFVENGKINLERLRETVHLAVRFLDDVIEVNRFPVPQIGKMTRLTRKIGLGVMGFADMLIKLGISYGEPLAVTMAEEVMSFITRESLIATQALAEERGPFPAFYGSYWHKRGYPPLRNATTTTIAPTGSISLIAGVSSGIEPIFGLYYERKTLDGVLIKEFHPLLEEVLKSEGYTNSKIEDLKRELMEKGLISKTSATDRVKHLFVSAFEIHPKQHLKIQKAFQQFTHNAVSKTINLPNSASLDDIREIFLEAYRLGLKGVTVYRYASKPEQVIYVREGESKGMKYLCPECGNDLDVYGASCICKSCGYNEQTCYLRR